MSATLQQKEVVDFDKVAALVAEGYVCAQMHPTADLTIFNYTAKTQFDWNWTPETVACRGLIADGERNVVARPFEKFFNVETCPVPLPVEPFEVFEKLDGSLGILYHAPDGPAIATRGSFVSEQARWATEWLRRNYGGVSLDPSRTYLFEIIYPSNRIVVDYGDTADLFLLAVIDTATGRDLPLEDIGFPVVKRYDGIKDVAELKALEESNREGFVVKFESGLRVKVKFEEYKRLHKLITGVNPRHVWEEMAAGRSLDAFLERVPDEYFNWLKGVERGILADYRKIEERCRADFRVLESRKDTALYFQTRDYPSVLFSMLDGKDHSQIIWKLVKPKAAAAFKCDEVG